jgi:hypothetical protein
MPINVSGSGANLGSRATSVLKVTAVLDDQQMIDRLNALEARFQDFARASQQKILNKNGGILDLQPINAMGKAVDQLAKRLGLSQPKARELNSALHQLGVTTSTDLLEKFRAYEMSLADTTLTTKQQQDAANALVRTWRKTGLGADKLTKELQELVAVQDKAEKESKELADQQKANHAADEKKEKDIRDEIRLRKEQAAAIDRVNSHMRKLRNSVELSRFDEKPNAISRTLSMGGPNSPMSQFNTAQGLIATQGGFKQQLDAVIASGGDFKAVVDKSGQAAEAAGHKIAVMGKKTSFAAEAFRRIGPVAARVFDALIVYKALAIVGQVFSKITDITIGMAIEFDKAEGRIRGVTGSAVFAKDVFDELRSAAGRIPLEFNEMSKASQIMIARGLNPSVKNLKILAATARAIDKPLENVIDQFARITITSGAESRGLKQLGIGFSQFSKELETATDRETALLNLLEGRNKAVFDEANQSLGDMTTRLINLVGAFAAPVTGPIVDFLKWIVNETAAGIQEFLEMEEARDTVAYETAWVKTIDELEMRKKMAEDRGQTYFVALLQKQIDDSISEHNRAAKERKDAEIAAEKAIAKVRDEIGATQKIEQLTNAIRERTTEQERGLTIQRAWAEVHEEELQVILDKIKAEEEFRKGVQESVRESKERGIAAEVINELLLKDAQAYKRIRDLMQQIEKLGNGRKEGTKDILPMIEKLRSEMQKTVELQIKALGLSAEAEEIESRRLIKQAKALNFEINVRSRTLIGLENELSNLDKVSNSITKQLRVQELINEIEEERNRIIKLYGQLEKENTDELERQLGLAGKLDNLAKRELQNRIRASKFSGKGNPSIGQQIEVIKFEKDALLSSFLTQQKALKEFIANNPDSELRELAAKMLYSEDDITALTKFLEAAMNRAIDAAKIKDVIAKVNLLSPLFEGSGLARDLGHVQDAVNHIAEGFAVGGPIGAGVAGLAVVGGWILKSQEEARKAAEKFRKEMEKVTEQFREASTSYREFVGLITDQEAAFERLQDLIEFSDYGKSLQGMIGFVDEWFDTIIDQIKNQLVNPDENTLGHSGQKQKFWLELVNDAESILTTLDDIARNGSKTLKDLFGTFFQFFDMFTDFNVIDDPADKLKMLQDSIVALGDIAALPLDMRVELAEREFELHREIIENQTDELVTLREEQADAEINALKEQFDHRSAMLRSFLGPILDLESQALRLRFSRQFKGAGGNSGAEGLILDSYIREANKLSRGQDQFVQQELARLQRQRDEEQALIEEKRDADIKKIQEDQSAKLAGIGNTLLDSYDIQKDFLAEIKRLADLMEGGSIHITDETFSNIFVRVKTNAGGVEHIGEG